MGRMMQCAARRPASAQRARAPKQRQQLPRAHAPPPRHRRRCRAAQYPWSGEAVVHGRRDKRRGTHTGRLTRAPCGAPRLECAPRCSKHQPACLLLRRRCAGGRRQALAGQLRWRGSCAAVAQLTPPPAGLPARPPGHLLACLSTCPPVCPPARLSVHLLACPPTCLPARPPVHLPACPPARRIEWGEPYAGRGTDTFELSPDGRTLTHTSDLTAADGTRVTYK